MTRVRVLVRRKPDRENLQLYYVDPLTGDDVTRSAGTINARKAERLAAEWEAELERDGFVNRTMSWDDFRIHYEDTHLAGKSPKTRSLTTTAMNHLEASLGHAKRLALIDSMAIATMVMDWRRKKIKESTIAAYLRHLRAAFGWAHQMQLIPQRPVFPMPKGRLKNNFGISVWGEFVVVG